MVNLPELTQLYLSNNKIKDEINLEYIRLLPNLTYIDITGNELAKKVSCEDFKDNVHVKLSDLNNPYYI